MSCRAARAVIRNGRPKLCTEHGEPVLGVGFDNRGSFVNGEIRSVGRACSSNRLIRDKGLRKRHYRDRIWLLDVALHAEPAIRVAARKNVEFISLAPQLVVSAKLTLAACVLGCFGLSMRIVIASSFVPFVYGGGQFIVDWLEQKLIEYGHQVERFYLPFVDRPDDLLDQILAFRLIDVSASCDRLIAIRPPAHVIPHPNKVLWFIHHIRSLYDLWDSPYRFLPDNPTGRAFRNVVMDLDTRTIREARHVWTNSQVVATRLKHFNGIDAAPLYPPIFAPERFRNDGYGDEIVVICRVELHKRQWLLVQAMRHVKTPVKLRLCGASMNPAHLAAIRADIDQHGLASKVIFEDRWISEEEKVERLAPALAIAYLPEDEDSYGYCSLEAAHSCKAVLTTDDLGGVLELVVDGRNGFVTPADPVALAEAMDQLFLDRTLARSMGEANKRRISELHIDWDTVVTTLTS